MKPRLGDVVYYHAKTIKNGPRAAIVTQVLSETTLNLKVLEVSRDYPALGVSDKPTTPVEHYWSFRGGS